jgi:hypothetical protein
MRLQRKDAEMLCLEPGAAEGSSGDRRYHCDECKSLVDAALRYHDPPNRLPPVLVLWVKIRHSNAGLLESWAPLLSEDGNEGGIQMSQTKRKYFPCRFEYGRMTTSGAQSVWGPMKAVLFEGVGTDLDQCTAASTILTWLLNQYPIRQVTCYGLKELMEDPEAFYKDIMSDKGWTRKQAKKYVNTVLFTFRNKRMNFGASDAMQKVRKLRDDACVIQRHFAESLELRWLYDLCKEKKPENPSGSMLSTMTHIIETHLTTAVKDYNIHCGRNVSCTTHDGMIVDGTYAEWEIEKGEWKKKWEDSDMLKEFTEVCEQVGSRERLWTCRPPRSCEQESKGGILSPAFHKAGCELHCDWAHVQGPFSACRSRSWNCMELFN